MIRFVFNPPHRLLVILKSLTGLLIRADLLTALPLDVTLLHLLEQEVGPAQPSQHRVGCVRWQEHCVEGGGRGRGAERRKGCYIERCVQKKCMNQDTKQRQEKGRRKGKLGVSRTAWGGSKGWGVISKQRVRKERQVRQEEEKRVLLPKRKGGERWELKQRLQRRAEHCPVPTFFFFFFA